MILLVLQQEPTHCFAGKVSIQWSSFHEKDQIKPCSASFEVVCCCVHLVPEKSILCGVAFYIYIACVLCKYPQAFG